MDRELRYYTAQVELRGGDGGPVITGHAAVFNSRSEDLGGWRETIAPGAFTEAIEKDDVRALWCHNDLYILGRNRSKTLKLAEDSKGLAIEILPPDTALVRDMVLEPIRRGDVSQMSFAFSVRPGGQSWEKDDDGFIVRTLKRVRVFDVSPVTFPAYTQTDVAVRSLNEWMQTRGELPHGRAAAARCVCHSLSSSIGRIEDRLALLEAHHR